MKIYPIFFFTLLTFFFNCGTDKISDGGGLETETISNISGTIVNTDGDSVENALVVATKSDSNNIVITTDTVLTDSDGFYIFSSLDTGLFTFEATKEINNLDYTAFIGQHYNDSSAAYLGIDTLKATGFIAGNVITDQNSSHFMGIEIYIPGTSFSAHSDSAGNFLISSVPIGKHLVAFDEPEFNVYTCSTSVDYPGDTAWLDSVILTTLNKNEYFKIYGSLLNFDGSAASNAIVTLLKINENDSILSSNSIISNIDGTYSFDSLNEGTYIINASIEINNYTYSFFSKQTFEEIENVYIGIDTLKATSFIKGNVQKDGSAKNNLGINISIPGTSYTAPSDSTGNFVLTMVPGGTYTITFKCSGYHSQSINDIIVGNNSDTVIIDTIILLIDSSIIPIDSISPPTNLTSNFDTTNQKVNLYWTPVIYDNLKGYIIYRKEESQLDSLFLALNENAPIADTFYNDSINTPIITEITYVYKIKSVDMDDNLSSQYSTSTSITLTPEQNNDSIIMIDIIGGTFIDAPGKNAGVSNFSISETEITLGQYKKYNPSWINLSGTNSDNEPVAGVSLSECFLFCNWLSKEQNLDTCYIVNSSRKATRIYGDSTYWELDTAASGYRIPSGDEWEYAAEGGMKYDYATSNGEIIQGSSPYNSNAWIPSVAKDIIQAVKFFDPNPFGLYDMTGNVWEYTWEADYLNKPNARNNYFDENETMNDAFIKVRGESAIYPISSPGLSWAEMKVDKCHTANSKTEHYFSDKARGFRIVKR